MSEGRIAGERGWTLVELMIGAMIALLVLATVLAIVSVTTQGNERVAARVESNQRIRPVMRAILDDLHSSCVASRVTPIKAGSDENSVSYLHGRGPAVEVTPELRTLTLSGGTLTRETFPATGGESPDWSFAGTPSQTRVMLTEVSPAEFGDPPVPVPAFQYYAYEGEQISSTPLPTPLSASDAAEAVQVTVSLATGSISTGAKDPPDPVSVSDTALLRFLPAEEGLGAENVPCA